MFDTERVFVLAWDYAGEKMGVGKAGYMVEKTLGMNAAASYKVWEEEFGERYDNDKLRQLTKEFLQNYYAENKVPVKKGLYVLLEYLGQALYKMAVASSSPRWEVEKYLKEAEIENYFEGIVCGDMVEHSKPDPEIYRKACELLGCAPKDCLALEDSRNGLFSAYQAGCRPIMVPDLEKVKEFLEMSDTHEDGSYWTPDACLSNLNPYLNFCHNYVIIGHKERHLLEQTSLKRIVSNSQSGCSQA